METITHSAGDFASVPPGTTIYTLGHGAGDEWHQGLAEDCPQCNPKKKEKRTPQKYRQWKKHWLELKEEMAKGGLTTKGRVWKFMDSIEKEMRR